MNAAPSDEGREQDQWRQRQAPCSICGNEEFAWGTVPDFAGGTFMRKEESAWGRLTGHDRIHEIEHRACYGCGAIQAFLKRPLPRPTT